MTKAEGDFELESLDQLCCNTKFEEHQKLDEAYNKQEGRLSEHLYRTLM